MNTNPSAKQILCFELADIGPDGVHLLPAAHQKLAERVADWIKININ